MDLLCTNDKQLKLGVIKIKFDLVYQEIILASRNVPHGLYMLFLSTCLILHSKEKRIRK